MNSSIIKSRWLLLATSCALLATMLPGNASITVTFKQVGSDVVASWDGSMDFKGRLDSKDLFQYGAGTFVGAFALGGHQCLWIVP